MPRLHHFIVFVALTLTLSAASLLGAAEPVSPDSRYVVGELLVGDDFNHDLSRWRVEQEEAGTVATREGCLEIDVAGGCTVWFNTRLSGPILISYEAVAVSAGGANDRVSDLNCFWMARDARSPDDIFGTKRSGKFADYDQLLCYYVGLGGNTNSTSRFRRYIGEKGNRPLRPEHDLSGKEFLLVPNHSQTIQLVAAESVVEYFRDGQRLFAFDDPQPYVSGWFAFRTVKSHLKVQRFRVYRLVPVANPVSRPTALSHP
jgi:hypothetical protein